MSEAILKRTTFVHVDGDSIVQVGDFGLPPPPPPPPPPDEEPPPPPPPDEPPPPPPDTFPTYASRQATIPPGTNNWQAIINANPSGTLFGITRGIHNMTQQIQPRSGDRFVGETDAAGVPISFIRGNWNGTQSGTGLATFVASTVQNLRFYRLDFSRFAPPTQQCINGAGHGWFTAHCYIHDNLSGGWAMGNNSTLVGGKIFHNGQIGLKTAGGGVDNVLVDGLECYDNNYALWNQIGFESGGMKFVGQQPTHMVMRRCHFHDNQGPGIWYDFTGGGNLIEDNLSHDNARAGIFYEGSGSAVIRRNTTYRNGGAAGIYIASSNADHWGSPDPDPIYGTLDIYVEDNICRDHNGHAEIWLKDDPNRVIRLAHVTVRRNKIKRVATSFNDFAAGHFGSTSVPPDVTFQANKYFTDLNDCWQWQDTRRTWTQWRNLGFDTTGTLQPASAF